MTKVESDSTGRYWIRHYNANGTFEVVMSLAGYATQEAADKELAWAIEMGLVIN